jgi:PAS domain S-box-containing protein
MSLLQKSDAATGSDKSAAAARPRWPDDHFDKLQGPPALSLDERGMIHDCTKSCEEFFGYQRPDLLKHHVSSLFPQLAGVALVQEGRFNPVLNFICRCGQLFQAQDRRGDTHPCNLFFVPIENNGKRTLRMIVNPSGSAKA